MFKNKLYTVNDTLNHWEIISLEVTKGTYASQSKLQICIVSIAGRGSFHWRKRNIDVR